MLTSWEIMQVWGQRAYGEPLYLPVSFAVDLKLLFKSKNFILKKEKFLKKEINLSISDFVLISSVDYEASFSRQLSSAYIVSSSAKVDKGNRRANSFEFI